MKKNKFINKYIIYISLIIIIIFIIFIIFYLYYIRNKTKYESFIDYSTIVKDIKYYRCKDKELSPIMQNIFDSNNIINSNENWDLYYPCGYNNIEQELKNIKINNSDNNLANKINEKFIFGINGCDKIVSKNNLWALIETCYGREKASTLIPESYILNNNSQLTLLKNQFDYKKNNIYILKKNVQRKEGLKLTRSLDEILYAKFEGYTIAQKYMSDLYLINDRKVNLRIYVLIMIKNNIIYFYISKKGKCIYTNKKYNHDELDFETNITSYNLDMSVYKENPRFFDELIDYIDEHNGIGEGEKLFSKIDNNLKNVFNCVADNMYQSNNIKGSTSFQLFGIDVIFNKNLEPFLLEFNKGPDMIPRDEIDTNMKSIVQKDIFKTVGLLNNEHDNDNNSFYLVFSKNK